MKRLLLSMTLGLLACIGEAQAASVYRCEDAEGNLSYGNRAEPGKTCRAVVRYTPTPTDAAKPDVSAPATEFRTAPAGASPSASVAPAGARVSRGAVYKYERDGVVHYTNVRPGRDSDAHVLFTYVETCFACAPRHGVDFHSVRLNTDAYREEIRAAATAFALDEALLRAVIHAESAFDPNARSHKGAQGLMQLMPATAERFEVADPYRPEQNIEGGSRYLAWLLKRYRGDPVLAAAAYNAGEGAVDRHGGVPPYEETRRYVERVGILVERYRSALAGAGGP